MSHSHAAAPTVFDETDPHGQHLHGQHESHVIVGPFTLRTILTVLLLFTALTVGISLAEVAIENWLQISLPWWVNVAGAMSIAVVKSLLVMAFFMQLKYDNPINTVIMLFCFFALGLFLMFTGLDLFTRSWIYDFKAGQIIKGGTGMGVVTSPDGKPMVEAARIRFMQKLGNPEIKESLVVADAIRAAAEEAERSGADAGKRAATLLMAHADHMTDLHTLMVHPPAPGEQARAERELTAMAEELRASGRGPVADLVADAAKRVKALNLAEAFASYSVEGQFARLAAQAHGGHQEAHEVVSTANESRARTGLTAGFGAPGAARHGQGEGPKGH